jgi:hypothetical protein
MATFITEIGKIIRCMVKVVIITPQRIISIRDNLRRVKLLGEVFSFTVIHKISTLVKSKKESILGRVCFTEEKIICGSLMNTKKER